MKFISQSALLMGVAALTMFAGCTSPKGTDTTTTTTGSATPTPAGGKISLAFVTNNPSDYWVIARRGVDAAAAKLPNVHVDFKIPANGTAAEQKQIIDDLIAKGVQGFAISPVDPAKQTQMLNDAAAKTTVITQDSDAPLSNRTCYIGTDNVAAGEQAGGLMKKALPNGGKIMLFVGSKDAQNAKDRIQGIMNAIKGTKIQVVDIRTDQTDRPRAQQNVEDSIVRNPDLAGCMGIWSYNGPAIARVVERMGKKGQIKIVCFDDEAGTIAGIKSGTVDATIVQQPYVFGEKAIEMLAAIASGDKTVVPASKKVIVPTIPLDKTNVDAHVAETQKLLKG